MASFKNLVSTTSAQISSGGTITGDLVINGDLQVDGGGSLSFDEIIEGTSQVKVTNTSAFLVEKSDGTDVFIVDTTNSRVGVNVTSPSVALHVSGDIQLDDSAPFLLFKETGSNKDMQFKLQTDGRMSLLNDNASTEVLTVLQSGSLGIGTASPSESLEVNGSGANLKVVSDANVYLSLDSTQTNGDEWQIFNANSGSTSTLQFKNIDQSKVVMLLDENGNTGIGTASPSELVEAEKDQNAHTVVQVDNNTAGTGASGGFKASADGADLYMRAFSSSFTTSGRNIQDAVQLLSVGASGGFVIASNHATADMSFWTNDTQRVTIEGDTGNTGIGTSSPYSPLHIKSSAEGSVGGLEATDGTFIPQVVIEGSGTTAAKMSPTLALFNSSTGADGDTLGSIMFMGGDSTTQPPTTPANASVYAGILAKITDETNSSNDGELHFLATKGNDNTNTAMSIVGSNVGIGVTPVGTLDVNISTDARGSFTDTIGEIGSGVFALQVTNAAGSALKPMGIRAEDIRLVTGSAIRLKLDDNSRISLSNNDGGASNTVFGKLAGNALASGGNYNLLIGEDAGNDLTTSDHNVAIGFQAFAKATASADNNTVVGNYAMGSIVSNDVNDCVVLGYNAIGIGVMEAGASGVVAVGRDTLKSLTSGQRMTAIGYEALKSEDAGSYQTAVGYQALSQVNNDNGHNTALGQRAGYNLTTGNANTLIGSGADASANSGVNQTVVGQGATGQADNSVTLGNASVTAVYMAQDSGATVHARHMNLIDSADNSSGGFLNLKNDRANPADNDEAGRIYMYADDDGGNQTEAILMIGRLTDVSNGNEDSDLRIYTYNNGTATQTLTLSSGSISKNSGSFKIDHPLESKKDTHHLVHSFVEAPQADNIYRGRATLSSGSVEINLDTVSGMSEGTFVLLNTNIQCFTSNESDWDAVKGSVSGNILTINCQNTDSSADVSWLVIGERQDDHMKETNWTDENGKVIVEPERNN